MNTKPNVKLIIEKVIAYILLIISIATFMSGWMTIKKGYVKTQLMESMQTITKTINSQRKGSYYMDGLLEAFQTYHIDIDPDEFCDKMIAICEDISDATLSPMEMGRFSRNIGSFYEISEEIGEISGTDLKANSISVSTVKIVGIIFTVIKIIAIISMILAFVSYILGWKMGSVIYSILNCVTFSGFLAMVLSGNNPFQWLTGFDYSLNNEFKAQMSFAAFVSFITAIAVMILWFVMVSQANRVGEKVPTVIQLIKEKAGNGGGVKSFAPRGAAAGSICPSCHKPIAPSTKFCPFCGTDVAGARPMPTSASRPAPDMIACYNCGKPYNKNGKFCPFCGTANPNLGAAPAPGPAPSYSPSPDYGTRSEGGSRGLKSSNLFKSGDDL